MFVPPYVRLLEFNSDDYTYATLLSSTWYYLGHGLWVAFWFLWSGAARCGVHQVWPGEVSGELNSFTPNLADQDGRLEFCLD